MFHHEGRSSHMFDIEKIAREVIAERVYVSEADFQLNFAMKISREYPQAQVRCEYPVIEDKKRKHIDIVVELDGKLYPIELKYRTKLLRVKDGATDVILANHSAHDDGCYKYLCDVERIGKLRDGGFGPSSQSFGEGYAIFLTNDEKYIKECYTNISYKAFLINHGVNSTGKELKGSVNGNEDITITLPERISSNAWAHCSHQDTNFHWLITKVSK